MITVTREHEISCGHRVHNHEGKCKNAHGHNYKFELTCTADEGLDAVGRVIDFSMIKEVICGWLEAAYDHRFLLWSKDDSEIAKAIIGNDPTAVFVSFNPTAENIAQHVLEVGNLRLKNAGWAVKLIRVVVHETSKCSATATLEV